MIYFTCKAIHFVSSIDGLIYTQDINKTKTRTNSTLTVKLREQFADKKGTDKKKGDGRNNVNNNDVSTKCKIQ